VKRALLAHEVGSRSARVLPEAGTAIHPGADELERATRCAGWSAIVGATTR
jgi:hypothetical protein